MDQTIKNGKRWSSAKAYLEPAIKSGKCQIIRGLVTKIIINKKQAEALNIFKMEKLNVFMHQKRS